MYINLENFHYYPFGMQMEGIGSISGTGNDYRYNGKELNEDYSLNWYDYGARWYDPAVGRWGGVDPSSASRSWISIYNYVQNNPILKIDPNGKLDGDYFNKQGKWLASDGVDDNKIYVVNDNSEANSIKKNGVSEPSLVQSKQESPGLQVLNESMNVLGRTVENGGLREESSLVMNDGTVVRGNTGSLPTFSSDGAFVLDHVPDLPKGSTDGDVQAMIHSHPTTVYESNGTLYPFRADDPSGTDKSTFTRFRTNVIVGPLGEFNPNSASSSSPSPPRPNGIAVYNQNGKLNMTMSASTVNRIINHYNK